MDSCKFNQSGARYKCNQNQLTIDNNHGRVMAEVKSKKRLNFSDDELHAMIVAAKHRKAQPLAKFDNNVTAKTKKIGMGGCY